jgi:hypothetical protein
MNKKKVIMFILYLVLVCNVTGMLIYFFAGFQKDPPSFVSDARKVSSELNS